MEFGYFTLSDNYYPDNPRSASDFVLEIREQAILADRLGFHSAWIGEHHFDRLGVNSRPDLVLASIVPVTERIRLAPAVNVLPIHHPIHVAECWATLDLISGGRVDYATGRGYDRAEYEPFGADFMQSKEIFEEGIDVVLKAWTEPGMWSHKGANYDIRDMEITPKPVQQPIPVYIACFSGTSMAMAAKARAQHHLRPVRGLDDLRRSRTRRSRSTARPARRKATRRAAPSAAISSTSPTPRKRRISAARR